MISTVNVTTSAAEAVAPNYARRLLILQNVSDTDMYIKMDASTTALTTANGIKLATGGAPLVITCQPGEFIHGISAIHGGSGNKDLRVQEA